MKKLTIAILTLMMALALAACGGNTSSEAVPGETTEYGTNAIAEYLNNGFVINQTSCDETHWKGILVKEGSWDEVYMAEATMTSELYKTYDGISFDDEDCDAKKTAFVTYLDDATVTDISDKIPSQEELDKLYVGKTLGDLEAEGFEDSGYTSDPDTLETSFFYDGPEYCVSVSPKKGTKIDMDDYSKNDLRKIVIATIEFQGLSSRITD